MFRTTIAVLVAALGCGDVEEGTSDSGPDVASDTGEVELDAAADVSSDVPASDAGTDVPLDAGPAYFVSVDGSPDNDGMSPDSAWTLAHGVAAVPGNSTLWVRAGDYGPQELVLEASGVWLVGYRDTIGDTVAGEYSTRSVDNAIDPTAMPTIDMGNPSSAQTALTVRGVGNVVENLAITNGNRGIVNERSAVGTVFRNVVIVEMGGDGSDNSADQPYEGFGLVTYARATVERSIFKNIGAHACQAFGVDASGSHFHHNDIFTGDFLQATDYGFLVNSDTDVSAPPITDVDVSYNRLRRVDGLWHGMHGIDFKYNVERSIMHHNTVLGTSLELSMPGSRNNVIEHNEITGYGSDPGNWQSNVHVYNGPGDNVIRNNVFRSLWAPILFSSNSEDLIGYGSSSNTGFSNNVIENNIAQGVATFVYTNVNLDGGNDLGDRQIINLTVRNNTVVDGNSFASWEFQLIDPVFENNVIDDVPAEMSMSVDETNNTRGSLVRASFVNNRYFGEHNSYYAVGFEPISDPLWVDRADAPNGLRPRVGSPLIDPSSSAGSARDFVDAVPVGTRDIGAFEYVP